MIYGDLKAGPGTIVEAVIYGLPIILNGYIAGQVYFFNHWMLGLLDSINLLRILDADL